jgi:4,4'-diaponeurosporenoate glycosyltransferase
MIPIFLLLWAAGFLLHARFSKRVAGAPCGGEVCDVSIIIPARNEAHNLPNLLGSIAAQAARPHEVLVVDDGSTDATAAIAGSLGARVISSQPLPDGWRGKTWACHQGACAAVGRLLLFMDADTAFAPGGLEQLLARYPGGAFSVSPYHAVREAYEDLSLFFNVCMTAGTVPDALAGQVLLVGQDAYERIGGHASVRGHVLENLRMATEFRDAEVPVRSTAGRGMVSFRMYPDGLQGLIEGWTKGFASGAGRTAPGILALVVAWMTGLMLPPLFGLLTGDWLLWSVAFLACAAQVAWLARKLGSFGWAATLFYPVPLVFFFFVFARSAMKSGKTVTWKGRRIRAD